MYALLYTARAKKDIKKLDPQVKERLETGLLTLSEDPKRGKPLVGDLKGLWSYRIGKCRVIYHLTEKVVIIEHVGYRREIYGG